MNKAIILLLAGIILVLATLPLAAQDEKLEIGFSADVTFMNKYVWRGIVLTDGFVMQPSGTLAAGGLSLNIWANMDLEDVNGNEYDFNEVDFTADYSVSIELLNLSAGLIYYTFPNTDFDSTMEVYVSAGLNTILSPSMTWYQDVDLVEGTYLAFGVGHAIPIEGSDAAVNLFASLGWGSEEHNAFYYGVSDAAFADFMAGASLDFALSDMLSISPMVAWSNLIDETISDMYEEPDTILFGVTGSISF